MDDLTPATELAATSTTRHPNESDEYRTARQRLLVEEIEVRRHAERVAEMRRQPLFASRRSDERCRISIEDAFAPEIPAEGAYGGQLPRG